MLLTVIQSFIGRVIWQVLDLPHPSLLRKNIQNSLWLKDFVLVSEVLPCEQQYDSSSQKFIVNTSVNNSGDPAKLMSKQELIQALDNKSLGKKKDDNIGY